MGSDMHTKAWATDGARIYTLEHKPWDKSVLDAYAVDRSRPYFREQFSSGTVMRREGKNRATGSLVLLGATDNTLGRGVFGRSLSLGHATTKSLHDRK